MTPQEQNRQLAEKIYTALNLLNEEEPIYNVFHPALHKLVIEILESELAELFRDSEILDTVERRVNAGAVTSVWIEGFIKEKRRLAMKAKV